MTLIAAVDLTESSLDVCKLGASLARRHKSRLVICHVVDCPPAMLPGLAAITPANPGPLVEDAARLLADLRAALPPEDAANISTRVLVGAADEALAGLAKELDAHLILVGTHARGSWGRLLLGSVAQALLLRAPCAVLAVRKERGAILGERLQSHSPLRVLVGLDPNHESRDAVLDWVNVLRANGPTDITFISEYWPPGEYTRLGLRGPRDLFGTDPEVTSILEREFAAKLGPAALGPGVRCCARAAWGPVGEALAREAEAAQADLVVVGISDARGLWKGSRGSTALSLLHATPTPVLCIPPLPATDSTHAPKAAPPRALRTILVSTDLSDLGNAAINHAFSLLNAGGVVHLCHVHEHALPSPSYAYADETGALSPAGRADLESRLRALVPAWATDRGIEARVTVIDGGEAASEITRAALRLDADAIALASHGRSGVKRALLGSVAEEVLRHAKSPVYIVPSHP